MGGTSIGFNAVLFIVIVMALLICVPVLYQISGQLKGLEVANLPEIQTKLGGVETMSGTGFGILTVLLLIIPVGVLLAALGITRRRRRGEDYEW